MGAITERPQLGMAGVGQPLRFALRTFEAPCVDSGPPADRAILSESFAHALLVADAIEDVVADLKSETEPIRKSRQPGTGRFGSTGKQAGGVRAEAQQ